MNVDAIVIVSVIVDVVLDVIVDVIVDMIVYVIVDVIVVRLVKTEVEVEMEIEGEGDESPQTVITTEEDEEVVLYWHNGARSKPIRDLAAGYQEGNTEDKATLDYYRYVWLLIHAYTEHTTAMILERVQFDLNLK